ncbi:MAG: chromate efflux transporter [Chloroflexi bacterium]|nr:chromate efflux transporter [Chloroflexota bacterium]
MTQAPNQTQKGDLGELARLFLRLGLTAFGGPAAHIAMYRDEVVNRRKWITDEHFLDLLGATNLIPGPNSTEMAIHIGLLRAGWRGLLVAGICFILPAMLIVLALAIIYDQYGTTPTATWLLYGIKPVIIAVVLQAVWGLSRKAIKNRVLVVIGLAVFGLYLLGFNELLLMFGGGLIAMLIANASRLRQAAASSAIKLLSIFPPAPFWVQGYSANGHEVSLLTLFLTFLKIGGTLYGSGYVLLAFVQNDFVERLGWLTNEQLLDAVAIGQFTPGPVFTTATFIGYLVAGIPGAVLATVAIFLPSFVLVYLSSPFIPRLRNSKWLGSLLDGVNIAALGLMAAVTVELGREALVDWVTVALAVAAAVLLIRFKVNSTWLIVGGALVGFISSFF